jgi:hypothetical protein
MKKLFLFLSLIAFIDSSAIAGDYFKCQNQNPNNGDERELMIDLEKGLLTFMDDKHFIPIVNITEKNIVGSEIRKDKVKETVIFDRYEGTVLWGLLAIENGGTVSQSYSCKKLKKTL